LEAASGVEPLMEVLQTSVDGARLCPITGNCAARSKLRSGSMTDPDELSLAVLRRLVGMPSAARRLCDQFRRGTLRVGGAVRVSPEGLAGRRSTAAKAWIISGVSKARLRLPTVVRESTLVSARRVIAWLVA
jgi:hypothetical protein